MRKTEAVEEIVVRYVTTVESCDRCGRSVNVRDDSCAYIDRGTGRLDVVESFGHTFGYGSRFDLTRFEFDLCDTCWKEMLDGSGVKYRTSEYTASGELMGENPPDDL